MSEKDNATPSSLVNHSSLTNGGPIERGRRAAKLLPVVIIAFLHVRTVRS